MSSESTMAPGSRVTRGSLAAAEDLASLSSRDRLIFSQAVYELGARQQAWVEIAKLMSRHPLVSRPKNFFTAQSCVTIYSYLMKEAEIERSDLCEAKKSPLNAQLAQRYYRERVAELRDDIAAEEKRFKTLVTEIEEIRTGKWDHKIKAKLDGDNLSPDVAPAVSAETAETEENVVVNEEATVEEQHPEEETAPKEEALDAEIEESEGEVPMDMSSPVRPSTPPLEPPPSAEYPEQHNLETAEQGVEEGTSISPSSEVGSPQSSELTAKTRSRTRREAAEATEESDEEIAEDEELASDTQEEHEAQKEEDEEATGSTPNVIPDEESSVRIASHEEEPSESKESTPVPQERREGKRRVSDVDVLDSSRDRKRTRDESEPADNADSPATPSAMPLGTKNVKERKRFQSVIGMLHAQITAHRNGTIFHNPIKPSEAPDYHDIVKRPMDLKTIKNRVRDGRISTSSEYQRDIYLMFANSLMYNRPNSDIYKMAEEMMLDSEAEIQNFQQTEAYNLRTRG